MLLTAGHDLDKLQLPLTLDVTQGTESYIVMRGEDQIVKAGDMMISDQVGIISNIIYGPDQRTQITESTRNVVFTVYAPAGIDEQLITQHLQDIRDYILVVAPDAQMELLQVHGGR
jgi:DNA/RNA-binding domain of Phe-tRNA-synthetase-like protein